MPRTENAQTPQRALYSPEYYSSLLAGLIHKLNNVTTVLSGHSGLILMDSDLPREIRDPVEHMAKATQLLSQIVDEAAIVAKSTPHRLETVDLESLFRACAVPPNLKVLAKNSPITGMIEADPAKLRQILEEIYRNARTAGATQVEYEIEEQNGQYVFRFRDNGKGVKKEVLPRIFDPFFTTRKFTDAFGLGLFRARGEIAQMKGEISATSDGSTFTEIAIKLPKRALPVQP
ncbi:MAG TPA: HAMP domain-containing sensor histidine kinase [Chthoniobacterales bacterium]|nr:HAMP domain-containing sensor histidine kinase [Chthoniobacterales bacterium]